MADPRITNEAVEAAARGMFAEEQCDKRQRQDLEGNWNSRLSDEDHAEYRALATAALKAALPHLRVHETPSKCLDCEHTHTPDGCTGQPSPSDVWAGVTPSICDCPSLRVHETHAQNRGGDRG